jgi:hypothetical protein
MRRKVNPSTIPTRNDDGITPAAPCHKFAEFVDALGWKEAVIAGLRGLL